ncbi:MAG: hypothetical protein ACFCBW_16860 [Candidatus Competibacterales bacterium]
MNWFAKFFAAVGSHYYSPRGGMGRWGSPSFRATAPGPTSASSSPPSRHHGLDEALFTALFLTLGHLGKGDGGMDVEIAAALDAFPRVNGHGDDVDTARRLYGEGSDPHFPLETTLDQFYRLARRSPWHVDCLVDILLQVAQSRGGMTAQDRLWLSYVCSRLQRDPLHLKCREEVISQRGSTEPTAVWVPVSRREA